MCSIHAAPIIQVEDRLEFGYLEKTSSTADVKDARYFFAQREHLHHPSKIKFLHYK